MSPATVTEPPATAIWPFETTSPPIERLPLPLTVMAAPDAPPQPAWLSAAMVGAYSRLLTLPPEDPVMMGLIPLVRIRPNCRGSGRVAVILNWLPRGPRADTTWVT